MTTRHLAMNEVYRRMINGQSDRGIVYRWHPDDTPYCEPSHAWEFRTDSDGIDQIVATRRRPDGYNGDSVRVVELSEFVKIGMRMVEVTKVSCDGK